MIYFASIEHIFTLQTSIAYLCHYTEVGPEESPINDIFWKVRHSLDNFTQNHGYNPPQARAWRKFVLLAVLIKNN